jgi:hypothetical protein
MLIIIHFKMKLPFSERGAKSRKNLEGESRYCRFNSTEWAKIILFPCLQADLC